MSRLGWLSFNVHTFLALYAPLPSRILASHFFAQSCTNKQTSLLMKKYYLKRLVSYTYERQPISNVQKKKKIQYTESNKHWPSIFILLNIMLCNKSSISHHITAAFFSVGLFTLMLSQGHLKKGNNMIFYHRVKLNKKALMAPF